jgi:ornithine lipid hydroxylase
MLGWGRVADYLVVPTFVAAMIAMTHVVIGRVPNFLVSGIVIGTFAVVAAVAERLRPERDEYRRLDQPFWIEAAHFFLNYNFGYALALGACAALDVAVKAVIHEPLWPSQWPFALQLVLAAFLGEGSSYWQHRLFHRVPWLWRFHALHHSGARLNLLRAGRFHFVDIGPAAFMALLPFVVLRAPDTMLTWIAVLNAALGVLDHSNIRMRTPAWLDWLVCTPAVHRHHHSRAPAESDRNFGTVVMLFDVLFGTYQKPRAEGPPEVGVENDSLPAGFLNQVFSPLRGTSR